MAGSAPRRAVAAHAPAPDDPHPAYTGRGLLRGRRALVFGGCTSSAGLGALVASALAKEGAAVAVADDTGRPGALAAALPPGDGGAVAGVARLAARQGVPSIALHCAAGSEAACRAAVAHATLEFGEIDVLAVCAGDDGTVEVADVSWLVRAATGFAGDAAVLLVEAAPSDRLPRARRASAVRLVGALHGRGVAAGRIEAGPDRSPEEVADSCVRLAARPPGRAGAGAVRGPAVRKGGTHPAHP